ncbi:AzlC family ABC transporter permease [Halostella sp. JP-L12]|uniref:AzlC family ABC transporter permease n=1 Tax=Halostella TaxID=1843185 RepID=UPI000EF7EC6D|nr:MULTISPECIES: AzlC family ABC transporter permease [Halostella]NHN49415.1 AzlC family ABC transporter permease [Halostella sp. JP-L12]
MERERRRSFVAGAADVGPILLGILPFALIAGVAAVEAGMTGIQAVAMSVFVFAGASQLAAIELIEQNAHALVIVGTVAAINLRLVMYSASIAPYLRSVSGRERLTLAYFLTDQVYAVSVTRFEGEEGTSRVWYFLGAGLPLWVVWVAGTWIGVVLGAGIPDGLSLDFAVPLTFIALLVPNLSDRPSVIAAAAASIAAVAGAGLPYNLGLIVGAVAGVATGVVAGAVE